MKKLIKRACCFLFVLVVFCASFPFSAFAVDPVSAGVMANAFAQAIAAYGASNGVAMTFDVASTNGIGESVHELWKDFREGTQDADDYATLAAALFPDLYYKASVAVGTASDVYTVGYNITSSYAEDFDNFFNWLLSGPAEMVKVDNQYYQFSSAQIGANAIPINVVSIGTWANQPLRITANSNDAVVANGLYIGKQNANGNNPLPFFAGGVSSSPVYAFCYPSGSSMIRCYVSSSSGQSARESYYYTNTPSTLYGTLYNIGTYYGSYQLYYADTGATGNFSAAIPSYSSRSVGLQAVYDLINNGDSSASSLGVKAYGNTGVAEFPDTADPNYQATQKRIPSTIPWDDSLFGDGTGTLTDAQSGAIAAEGDAVLDTAGVLDIAGEREATDEPGTDDPPSTDPDDYTVVGLADLFPFCIPFDIYHFLEALAAAPVAPHFTCTFNFPAAIGGQQTIDIDFDAPVWNQLAQLLRLLELLAFIVGLALLTRSMFIRG